MKIILKEDVETLGRMGDLVTVSDGYARNFLIPKKKAVEATSKSVKALEHEKRLIADQARKLKKEALAEEAGLTLELVRNPDILAEVGRRNREEGGRRIVVGFAAESEDLVAAARRKLERKGCDLVVANDVSQSDRGFEVDTNAVTVVTADGEDAVPLQSKDRVAAVILDNAERLLRRATDVAPTAR